MSNVAEFTCRVRITCTCGHVMCANPEHPEGSENAYAAERAHFAAEHEPSDSGAS